ncbi:MAG: hypothetical protein L3K25_19485 [Gammaproteobacteria bacterium]|nr:hypothetical protein [Gammaproteobacteria bacterium]
MKKVNVVRRGLAFFCVSLAGLGLLASGMAYTVSAAEGSAAEATRFVQLDAAAERVLNEVAALGAQMVVLEEAQKSASHTRLRVLVTVDPGPFFQLDAIQLHIDERMVSFHQYTETELAALQKGGSHRLFWGDVSVGQHKLTVSMMGRTPKESDFQRTSTLVITSDEGRGVVELRIAPGENENQPFPEMRFKEWK